MESDAKLQFTKLINISCGTISAKPDEVEKTTWESFNYIMCLRTGHRLDGKFYETSIEERIYRLEEDLYSYLASSRGSEVTANERAHVLYRFLRAYDLSLSELVETGMKDGRKVEDTLSKFVGNLLRKGKSPRYVANYLKAVRFWLNYKEIRLVRKIKIVNRNLTPTIEDV